ncbi:MAG TPA: class III extradiol ring-cleavage dioxygenase [Alphaproteobacteria bacterium]
MIPTLFVSHGAPTLPLEGGPARDFFNGLGAAVGKPAAILAVSAHWETRAPAVGTAERPATIHDFYGFPRALYEMTYPAPGAPEVARRAAACIRAAGFDVGEDRSRGLDHGAWVPLMMMYPLADVPVAQLSIQPALGPAHHAGLGRALAPLRDDGVLILASGSAVHNLSTLAWGQHGTPPAWAKAFDDWLEARIAEGAHDELIAYRERAPGAAAAHPRDEHLLPLFVAMGAAGPQAKGTRLHSSFMHGSLSMAAFSFS